MKRPPSTLTLPPRPFAPDSPEDFGSRDAYYGRAQTPRQIVHIRDTCHTIAPISPEDTLALQMHFPAYQAEYDRKDWGATKGEIEELAESLEEAPGELETLRENFPNE